MTKVLWFSRHSMSAEQHQALVKVLGDIDVVQIDRTIAHASELKSEIDAADVIAIVAPLSLQAEFKELSGQKPVIFAESERILVKSPDGEETKVQFVFKRWTRIDELTYKVSTFAE